MNTLEVIGVSVLSYADVAVTSRVRLELRGGRPLMGKRQDRNQKRNVDGLLESSVFCLPGEISLQEALACFVCGSG